MAQTNNDLLLAAQDDLYWRAWDEFVSVVPSLPRRQYLQSSPKYEEFKQLRHQGFY